MSKKNYILLLLLLFFAFTIQAQFSIHTKIITQDTKEPVEFVAVRLLQAKDSSLVSGITTDSTGNVKIANIRKGEYIIHASLVGYSNFYQAVSVVDKNLNLDPIEMEEDSRVLKELEVTGAHVEVTMKGDTIEYNAAAFKTEQNAVVEDLLKKMPGVEITPEGKIMVNGQEITKIRVDGKKFFGDDVEMSTKNIPADMIDRVQVLDQRSEMAQLTGFEDGDTERIINLTLRRDRRQGVFGNVQAGVGADMNPEFRYDGNTFLNIMNNDSRSSITAGANNTNTSRSSRGRGGFGGGRSGITETQNIGYNLNIPLSTKMIIGGDVTFNHSDNLVESNSVRETYLQGTTFHNFSDRSTQRENYDGNIRLEMEYKPDSTNSIIFQPNIGFGRSFSNSSSSYLYLDENDSTSWGNTNNIGDGLEYNAGLTVIYSKKMAKPGRNITTRISSRISQSDDNGFNISEKYTAAGDTTIVDQRSNNTSNSTNFGIRISYVEPLGLSKKHFLETALSFNGNLRNSNRELFDKNALGEYIVKNEEYSNEFNNRFFRETLDMNYRFVQQDYNLTLGFSAEPSQTYSTRVYANGTEIPLKNEVFNIAPAMRFQYNFGKRKYARIEYRGRTDQPSINQMQPVKNNTNLMNETVGNPTLNPSFNHNLRLMYSSTNSENLRSINIGMYGNATKDDLTSNSINTLDGKRYVQTINSTEIPYNLNTYLMYNIPFLKKFNFSTNTSLGTNQQYGYNSKRVDTDGSNIEDLLLNNLKKENMSNTIRYNASENLSLRFSHSIIDVGLRGGVRYAYSKSNLNEKATETYDWTSSLNLSVRPVKNFSLSTDMNFTKQAGYANFNPSQWLWNASSEYTAFKGKGIFALRVVDLLRQRQNINQNVGDNFVEVSRTNSLPSYFILSFTYKISHFKGMNAGDRRNFEESTNSRLRYERGGYDRGGYR